jgi:hypothetical protein
LHGVQERTNSWQSDYGQLRGTTDRRTVHRLAQLALAVALLLTAKRRLAKPLVTRPNTYPLDLLSGEAR